MLCTATPDISSSSKNINRRSVFPDHISVSYDYGLAGEYLLVECCVSEKVVCFLVSDSKGNVFGVGEVIDIIRFRDLEKLLQMTAYVCRFVANLKLQKKGDELIVGQLRAAEICEDEKNVDTL